MLSRFVFFLISQTASLIFFFGERSWCYVQVTINRFKKCRQFFLHCANRDSLSLSSSLYTNVREYAHMRFTSFFLLRVTFSFFLKLIFTFTFTIYIIIIYHLWRRRLFWHTRVHDALLIVSSATFLECIIRRSAREKF
jgi:hypothetical protein